MVSQFLVERWALLLARSSKGWLQGRRVVREDAYVSGCCEWAEGQGRVGTRWDTFAGMRRSGIVWNLKGKGPTDMNARNAAD